MNTCVLCLRRRNAFEWTIRSRSRTNGVRWSESGLGLVPVSRVRGRGKLGQRLALEPLCPLLNEVRASCGAIKRVILSPLRRRDDALGHRGEPVPCSRRGRSPISQLLARPELLGADPMPRWPAPPPHGDRHAIRRAAHVVEPGELEERDRVRVAAVLPADPELESGFASRPTQAARRTSQPTPACRSSRTGCARRSSPACSASASRRPRRRARSRSRSA